MPWIVEIHAPSARSASPGMPAATSAPLTRALISAAAFFVNVMASTSSTPAAKPLSIAWTMRRVSVKVLPLPAPADTATGMSSVSMQAR